MLKTTDTHLSQFIFLWSANQVSWQIKMRSLRTTVSKPLQLPKSLKSKFAVSQSHSRNEKHSHFVGKKRGTLAPKSPLTKFLRYPSVGEIRSRISRKGFFSFHFARTPSLLPLHNLRISLVLVGSSSRKFSFEAHLLTNVTNPRFEACCHAIDQAG